MPLRFPESAAEDHVAVAGSLHPSGGQEEALERAYAPQGPLEDDLEGLGAGHPRALSPRERRRWASWARSSAALAA